MNNTKESRPLMLTALLAKRWIDSGDEELGALAYQTWPELREPVYPKSWEELQYTKGYCITKDSKIEYSTIQKPCATNRSIWPTKELAEASIALAQLLQLRDEYNKLTPDADRDTLNNHLIFKGAFVQDQDFTLESFSKITGVIKPLRFDSRKTRDLFYVNFKHLLNIAKPLL